MTDVEITQTRERILRSASELFAKYGFSGASVRDIAYDSDVNVAAINYHFGNKHNLYWSVVKQSHDWAEMGIREIALSCECMEDLVIRVFDFMMSNKDAIRTTLKIMLTDGVPLPEGELREAMVAQQGPPGLQDFKTVFRRQYGDGVSEANVFFAVRSIFGNLIHSCMICSCSKIDLIRDSMPELSDEAIRQQLIMHARAICEFVIAPKPK